MEKLKIYDLSKNKLYIAAVKECEKRNKDLAKKAKKFDFTNMECYDLQCKKHYTSLLNKKWLIDDINPKYTQGGDANL